MKKQILAICLALGLLSAFNSCSILDDDGDGNGNGDTNKNLPMELDFDNFRSNLILEDRNDGVDYIITESISAAVDIEVKPGVVIEFVEGSGLDITDGGTLNAVGLEDNKITFTGSIKSRGAWIGILVQSNSLKNVFQHCIIEYGGSKTWGNGMQGGLTTWADAGLNVSDCVFRNNQEYGVQFYNDDEVIIRGFESNSFENNDKALKVDPAGAHQLGRNNVFVGNDPKIEIYEGDVFTFGIEGESKTWKKHDVPYLITGSVVCNENNLTLEAGTNILFGENGYLEANAGSSLTAIGNALEPIVFDGLFDVTGSWPGISFQFTQSNRNQLEHVIIRNAGSGNQGFGNGCIYMWGSPNIKFNQCQFINISSCVFFHASSGDFNPNLTYTNTSFTNTGEETCN